VDFPYRFERLGVVMEPDPADPHEVEGALNPAAAIDGSGSVVLFPRLVAAGNVSRIGRARVRFAGGVPTEVRREGVVLEPDRSWERGEGHGGVEDPRVTRVEALGCWLMTYVAWGPLGPRTALARSTDLVRWERLGPLLYGYDDRTDLDLNLVWNKDVVVLPEPVAGPDGRPALAVLHRPMWGEEPGRYRRGAPLSIWLSYVDLDRLTVLTGHREIMRPERDWERDKIGAGAPPVRVREGWLLTYHGVAGGPDKAVYRAGAALLDPHDPGVVLARSAEPLLEPDTVEERSGTVSNVVFPTALLPHQAGLLCFYGMADSRIGAARLVREGSPR
jgi:beta-1,2-mannobiose phosphorylase / 1,2-beta-oligomannan phosphorylase